MTSLKGCHRGLKGETRKLDGSYPDYHGSRAYIQYSLYQRGEELRTSQCSWIDGVL